MPIATLTSKSQITVPAAVRDALGLRAGSKLDFVPTADGFKVVAVQGASATLKGRFAGRAERPVSLADIDKAIAQEAARRHQAGSKRK